MTGRGGIVIDEETADMIATLRAWHVNLGEHSV